MKFRLPGLDDLLNGNHQPPTDVPRERLQVSAAFVDLLSHREMYTSDADQPSMVTVIGDYEDHLIKFIHDLIREVKITNNLDDTLAKLGCKSNDS